MKHKLALISAFIAFAIAGKAQTNGYPLSVVLKKVGVVVQTANDELPGEAKAFTKYLATHIDTTLSSLRAAPVGNFNVLASYTIDEDGRITDITTENNPGYGAAEEVNRAMKSYFEITPIMKDGKPVVFHGKLTVLFTVYENKISLNQHGDKFFASIKEEAEFPGGQQAWFKYLQRNLNSNIPYSKGAPTGKYNVTVSFLVNDDGIVSNVKAENNPGYGTAEEAMRVIQSGPKWKPAIQNGHNVAYTMRQLITFIVSR